LKDFKNPILQPYIAGKEISADCYISKYNKVIGIVIRHRKLIIEGESKISIVIRNNLIEKKIKNYISSLNLYGPVMIQAKLLGKKLHIIECNSRIGGASTHSINYGLDVIYWALLECIFQKPKLNFYKKKYHPLSQFRFPADYYN
jgi:carbamoyl-phosphate synthase large subunit